VFVLDPKDDGYLEVPTRDLSRPAISLWEHRLARRRLRTRHRGEVNETALYAAIEEMRAAEREAERLTRSARRDRTRRASAPDGPAAITAPPATTSRETATAAAPTDPGGDVAELPQPFDDIEQW
jgi:putative transposase